MLVKLLGIVMLDKLMHPSKAEWSMLVTLYGIVISLIPLQLQKAYCGIIFTCFPILIVVNFSQALKIAPPAYGLPVYPMHAIASQLTVVSALQSQNARSDILITLDGIVMLEMPVHLSNADAPICSILLTIHNLQPHN